MKILKYLIFLSILCVIFSVIYRQSDKSGFRRWLTLTISLVFSGNLFARPSPGSIAPADDEKLNQIFFFSLRNLSLCSHHRKLVLSICEIDTGFQEIKQQNRRKPKDINKYYTTKNLRVHIFPIFQLSVPLIN